jgi:predicted PP-loop superfamily ATPase
MSGTYSNAPCTKEGYKIFSITLAILDEFFVNSLFHLTKTRMVYMMVLVYSNFSKKNCEKNEISKLMRNGRFHPSKCRNKVEKTGEETLKGLSSNLLIPTTYLFGLMWSTLAGQLQHVPILLLKFSNTHNF